MLSSSHGDNLPEYPTPITKMRISDHSISEVVVDITDRLSDRWSADMTDMKWFSDICSDIVDDDRLIFWYVFLFSRLIEDPHPHSIREGEIDISAHTICLSKYL